MSNLLLPALLAASSGVLRSHSHSLLRDDDVVFVGRVLRNAADRTTLFDMNGVQIQARVTGTASLYASMSQVQKVQGNVFQVYLDGALQPLSRFNTSAWVAGEVVKVPLFPSGSLDAAATHAVVIFKDAEPGGQMNHTGAFAYPTIVYALLPCDASHQGALTPARSLYSCVCYSILLFAHLFFCLLRRSPRRIE